MMQFQHPSLASGRWATFTLMEQLANIGSEVGRAARAQGKDEMYFKGAVLRALELFYLTIEDPRNRKRLKELTRARELFCAAVLGSTEYNTNLEHLDRYFMYFAWEARKDR